MTCHPSQPSLPDHPFVVIGLVGAARPATSILSLLLILGLLLARLAILGSISLCLPRVRVGSRALRSGSSLGDYNAVSITRSRNERYKTKLPRGPTSALRAVGQLNGQLLRAGGLGNLGDMSQYEDNRARSWTVPTASPLTTIWQLEKLFPVPVGSTIADWSDRELFAPLKALPNQLTRSPVEKWVWIIYSRSEICDLNFEFSVCICRNSGGIIDVLTNGLIATASI
jgi:hypothetical protein